MVAAGEQWIKFLSRLCGGQPELKSSVDVEEFLSRLCGGQRWAILAALTAGFLSRLCGGQQQYQT